MFLFFFSPFCAEPKQLSEWLRHIAPSSPLAQTARDALQSIGYQLIWNMQPVPIPEQSVEVLAEASHAMAKELAHQTERLRSLGDRWDAAKNQADADAIAMEPLDFGLKAMFAREGIDGVVDQYPSHSGVEAAATELARAHDTYDEALVDHVGVLCTLADGSALKRVRKLLPESCATAPWWLGGVLEEAAEKLATETDRLVDVLARRLGNS